jgi:hypothetical protein
MRAAARALAARSCACEQPSRAARRAKARNQRTLAKATARRCRTPPTLVDGKRCLGGIFRQAA